MGAVGEGGLEARGGADDGGGRFGGVVGECDGGVGWDEDGVAGVEGGCGVAEGAGGGAGGDDDDFFVGDGVGLAGGVGWDVELPDAQLGAAEAGGGVGGEAGAVGFVGDGVGGVDEGHRTLLVVKWLVYMVKPLDHLCQDVSVDERGSMTLAVAVLAAAAGLVEAIHEGVVARGFGDVRPAHGFVFVRIAPDGATAREIADHLGVTKQAGSQLVEELIAKGYVVQRPHPSDARARLVVLTERGWACTRAAEQAAADAVGRWAGVLGERRLVKLRDAVGLVAPAGRLRPTW